jgi:hypothetical protein
LDCDAMSITGSWRSIWARRELIRASFRASIEIRRCRA